jgi:hypothetical protein
MKGIPISPSFLRKFQLRSSNFLLLLNPLLFFILTILMRSIFGFKFMLFHSSFGSSAASFQAFPFKGFIIANGNTILFSFLSLMFKLCHFNFFFTSTCSTLPCPLLNCPRISNSRLFILSPYPNKVRLFHHFP